MFLFAGLEVGGEAARATFVTFLTQPGEDGAGFEWKFWRLGTLGLGSVSGFSLSLSPTGMLPPGASNPTAWPRSKAALALKLRSQSLRTLVFPA